MSSCIDFGGLLSPQVRADALLRADPRTASAGAPPIVIAWNLLAGSTALRRARCVADANAWLAAASITDARAETAVLAAELLAEAGLTHYADGRFPEAAPLLDGAAGHWAELCDVALDARTNDDRLKTLELGREIAVMVEALGGPPPFEGHKPTGASSASLVRGWLEHRAVARRTEVFAALIRLLARGSQIDDARRVCLEAIDWTSRHFTRPVARRAFDGRAMTGATRFALYRLLLAQGDVELAAGAYRASAECFAAAAAIYQKQVETSADMSRRLQARFNEANSLLRLDRYEEAINIYTLVEMGFSSIGDDVARLRVAHAKHLARMQHGAAGEV